MVSENFLRYTLEADEGVVVLALVVEEVLEAVEDEVVTAGVWLLSQLTMVS